MTKKKEMKTLDVTEMLPTKFQAKAVRQFIVRLDGIDSFLFNSIDRGCWSRDSKGKGLLVAEVHDAVSPSGEQQVREWIDCQTFFGRRRLKKKLMKEGKDKGTVLSKEQLKRLSSPYRDLTICYLDPVGTIVSEVTYTKVRLDRVGYTKLTYDSSAIVGMRLEMSYDEEILKY